VLPCTADLSGGEVNDRKVFSSQRNVIGIELIYAGRSGLAARFITD
jgi:hypothetical protein